MVVVVVVVVAVVAVVVVVVVVVVVAVVGVSSSRFFGFTGEDLSPGSFRMQRFARAVAFYVRASTTKHPCVCVCDQGLPSRSLKSDSFKPQPP